MRFSGLICVGALLFGSSVTAQEGGKDIEKTSIILGTATPGGFALRRQPEPMFSDPITSSGP